MNIIVCIKQVPETQEVRLDPVTHTLKREGIAAIINPFDLYALEEGLRVKDAHGGTVTVITMGPPQAEAALREALGYRGRRRGALERQGLCRGRHLGHGADPGQGRREIGRR